MERTIDRVDMDEFGIFRMGEIGSHGSGLGTDLWSQHGLDKWRNEGEGLIGSGGNWVFYQGADQ